MAKEVDISIGDFPGFRFSPTEEELISYYLKKKIEGFDTCVEVIAEIEITQFEPWDLPAKSIIQSDNEWFFFSARGRKYPRGLQSRRATESGYWKATGKERSVKTGSNIIGTKRTLVFHKGRAPKGERTEWIMHEYCMSGTSQEAMVVCRLRRNGDFHFHDSLKKQSLSRHSQDGECSSFALPQEDLRLKGVLNGDTAVDGFYKDCSNSDNSQSVEHIDSEFESDHKLANEIFQDGSCSPHKVCEDDCFADILNDDIIKLDESSLSKTPDFLQRVGTESKVEAKLAQPSQGTANRRIRLWRQEEDNYPVMGISTHTWQSPHYLMSTLSDVATNHRGTVILEVTKVSAYVIISNYGELILVSKVYLKEICEICSPGLVSSGISGWVHDKCSEG